MADRLRFPVFLSSLSDEAVQLIATLPVQGTPIAGVPDLMHHKYAVRDGTTLWSGSTNWTDDSWTREENVIATAGNGVWSLKVSDHSGGDVGTLTSWAVVLCTTP